MRGSLTAVRGGQASACKRSNECRRATGNSCKGQTGSKSAMLTGRAGKHIGGVNAGRRGGRDLRCECKSAIPPLPDG